MMQMTFGLLLVLAMIGALGWGVSRLRGIAPTGNAPVKVVGATAVGTRERVVVVEVGGQWLVVGVGAGGVTLLDKTAPQPLASVPPSVPELPAFAAWLKRAMDKRAS